MQHDYKRVLYNRTCTRRCSQQFSIALYSCNHAPRETPATFILARPGARPPTQFSSARWRALVGVDLLLWVRTHECCVIARLASLRTRHLSRQCAPKNTTVVIRTRLSKKKRFKKKLVDACLLTLALSPMCEGSQKKKQALVVCSCLHVGRDARQQSLLSSLRKHKCQCVFLRVTSGTAGAHHGRAFPSLYALEGNANAIKSEPPILSLRRMDTNFHMCARSQGESHCSLDDEISVQLRREAIVEGQSSFVADERYCSCSI